MGGVGGRGVVLGVSCDFHDAAAALLVDGEIVAAVEEERLSRVKHDSSLPARATAACLDIADLAAEEIDAVAFYEKPLLVANRYLATRQQQNAGSLRPFLRDAPRVFGRNLLVGYRIASMLRSLGMQRPPRIHYGTHHGSHAAAAFYPSPFDEAAIVTVDGIGEWATATIGAGHGNRISLLEELRFPDSIGLLYSLVTAFCGFRANDDEYKVMGLAPYGVPRFREQLSTLMRLNDDGSVSVDAKRVSWFSPRALERPELAELLGGPPRRPSDPISAREIDLACSVQAVTTDALMALAQRAHDLTGLDNVCMAGGVALNCVANGHIARDGPFSGIWIQPAAGDAGSAIGAALAHWHLDLGNPRPKGEPGRDRMRGSALGRSYAMAEIEYTLAERGFDYVTIDDPDELAAHVASRLAAGDIVGWFSGPMEFGPRALGHRSILADPRSPVVRQRLNRTVKGREDFRPFAPAVLAEESSAWFDLDVPSPYMLVVADVLPRHLLSIEHEPESLEDRASLPRSVLPACTHVDGSARIQTVERRTNPEFHRLLSAFHRQTGCAVLVNTSFNRAGEPIVESPADALVTAANCRLDLLVLEHALITMDGSP